MFSYHLKAVVERVLKIFNCIDTVQYYSVTRKTTGNKIVLKSKSTTYSSQMLLRVLFTFLTDDALACLRSDGLIGYNNADESLE